MMQREAKNAAEGGKTGSHDIHGDLAEHRPVAGQSDMRVFYGFDALPHFVRPTVTVGSYDGVHSGHLALLRTVAGRARAQGGESVVLTFEPHPRVTLGRADGLRLLTSLEEKIYLLGQQGIDNLIVIPFDKAFSALAPDNFTIAVNGNHPIVADILSDAEKAYGDKLKSITKKIDAAVAEENRFEEVTKGKKEEELTAEEKAMREELSKKVVTLRDERNERLREIGGENKLVKQIIDLALLTNGMLKGKSLTDFIQRSISLIEK